MRVRWLVAAVALIALAGGPGAWLVVEARRGRLVWDHFDVVKPGVLYRSGQLAPEQLADAMGRLGLQTVVSFQLPGPEVDRERAVVEAAGARFVNLPMPGDGFGRPEQFRQVLALADDPATRPVLVHCARGTCRTGASVALYRLERDGWAIEDVDAEMKRQVYRSGWLAGYVYQMVERRPTDWIVPAEAPPAMPPAPAEPADAQ